MYPVTEFIESAQAIYPDRLKKGRGRAFEVYMKEKNLYYLPSIKAFMPYFEEFIGKR